MGQNDRESSGTVVRTPHQRSLADVSRAALELFENGISFDHSFRPSRAGRGASSGYESPEAISPTSKVNLDSKPIRSSTSQPFLGKRRNILEDPGREQKGSHHRMVARKTFHELTNSLRTKQSPTNVLMANTHTRIQNITKKHIRRRSGTGHPTTQPIIGAWVEGIPQTEPVTAMAPTLPFIEHQEPLQIISERLGSKLGTKGTKTTMFQMESTEQDITSTISAGDQIRQDVQNLRAELQHLDSATLGKENRKLLNLRGPETAGIREVDTTMKQHSGVGESVCTRITITTRSPVVGGAPAEDCTGPPVMKQEKSIETCPEKKPNSSLKTGDMPINTPSDTTSPAPTNLREDAKPYVLKTTRAANRLQLRQTKANAAPQKSEPNPAQAKHEAVIHPKVSLKVGYIEERKKTALASSPVASITTAPATVRRDRCDTYSECLQASLTRCWIRQ